MNIIRRFLPTILNEEPDRYVAVGEYRMISGFCMGVHRCEETAVQPCPQRTVKMRFKLIHEDRLVIAEDQSVLCMQK